MSNPLTTCHFIVDLGPERIKAIEVIGLSKEIEAIAFREGSSPVTRSVFMPGREKINRITIIKHLVKGENQFSDWFNTIKLNTVERRDIVIQLLNENHEPVVVWKLNSAFPTKVEWSDLNSRASEAAIESIELIHEGIKIDVL